MPYLSKAKKWHTMTPNPTLTYSNETLAMNSEQKTVGHIFNVLTYNHVYSLTMAYTTLYDVKQCP